MLINLFKNALDIYDNDNNNITNDDNEEFKPFNLSSDVVNDSIFLND